MAARRAKCFVHICMHVCVCMRIFINANSFPFAFSLLCVLCSVVVFLNTFIVCCFLTFTYSYSIFAFSYLLPFKRVSVFALHFVTFVNTLDEAAINRLLMARSGIEHATATVHHPSPYIRITASL